MVAKTFWALMPIFVSSVTGSEALASTIPLEPVMSLTSRIVAVKGVRPGEGVGYGPRFEADSPRTRSASSTKAAISERG